MTTTTRNVMTRESEEQFRVYLYDRPIALLHRRGDFTRFVLDVDYVQDPHRRVLGLRFGENLRARHASHMRLPSWVSNLLPEGRLREWIAEAPGVLVQRRVKLLGQGGLDRPW